MFAEEEVCLLSSSGNLTSWEEKRVDTRMTTDGDSDPVLQRRSLCMSSSQPGITIHAGENAFAEGIQKYFLTKENNAAEKLMQLKEDLATAEGEQFWQRMMEGMTDVCGAQFSFVAKRILVDDHDAAVEMPPIGEVGACLMGVAFYYNNGHDIQGFARDYKYFGWSCPCAHMRHDKVFLIPENLSSFITNNPNTFPFPCESYIGIPLFSGGKCFAHFGLMYTEEGLRSKGVSWGYTEMLLHSLEDLVKTQLLSGQGFAKSAPKAPSRPSKVIPQNAITASQSLKPYARSLSHELRTPMQGVVGMLDVMHATVQESIEGAPSATIRNIFQALRENIEVVQDSSRRAVEAADNVVHAYDLNMQIPDTPQNDSESPATNLSTTATFESRPNILIEGSNIPVNPHKRRRSSPVAWQFGNPTKQRDSRKSPRRDISPKTDGRIPNSPLARVSPDLGSAPAPFLTPESSDEAHIGVPRRSSLKPGIDSDIFPTPGLRHSNIRTLIPMIIHDSLHVGGRPDSAVTVALPNGERIEVRSRSSNGECSQKTIEWSVSDEIPETLLVDERDLAKLISCIFLNAIKFTESGWVTIKVRPSINLRFIVINIIDTGAGIPRDFLPQLFKPFSREDDSLTRSKEGLGLGLMVAKGLSRKIGGDLNLIRSEIDGPNHGSDFEIRVPIDSSDGVSRPGTPRNRTPTPTTLPSDLPKMTSLHTLDSIAPRSPKLLTPMQASSPPRQHTHIANIASLIDGVTSAPRRSSVAPKVGGSKIVYDKHLSERHPLTFLVAEDNKINRKLLVNMLSKFGYKNIYEAFDGVEAVRIMREVTSRSAASRGVRPVDVILMDLWMPEMDGYEACERILNMFTAENGILSPTILAVSADVTDEAIDRATRTGMEGFMTKPYKLMDLQRLIEELCVRNPT